jgi:hypothetical protein
MAPGNHNKIIDQAAKKILKPLGCAQKGKSRTWLDDQRWWVGGLEFQPSSWSRGSYLNVGAMWLWNAKDYLSFDDGYRVDSFHAYRDDEQFSEAAVALAERAAEEVLKLRQAFGSIGSVARHLAAKQQKSVWDHFHSAIAAGLAGDVERAQAEFSAVAAAPVHAPWVATLQEKAAALSPSSASTESMRRAVADEIADARGRLKMPACQGPIWG